MAYLLLNVVISFFLFTRVAEAVAPVKIFDITQFGTIADGKEDSSKALLDAWKEACEWNGRGTVSIPQGTFLMGPIVLGGPCKGYIVFEMNGLVKAPTDLKIFSSDGWIEFDNIYGMTITGGGTFDDQGASAWPYNECKKNYSCKLLPVSLKFHKVENVKIGRITSINSKSFHISLRQSKNIELAGIKISALANSPNTDGINIGNSRGISIINSKISTGDDCVSIVSGTYNVTISNVFCGPGHGISVGSLGKYADKDDVMDATVKNCAFVGTDNCVRIKTWPDSPASIASNITFENIIMKNVENPIIIDQEYCPVSDCNTKSPSQVKIQNVFFTNISGASATRTAVELSCSKSVACENLQLKDINLKFEGGESKSNCSNVNGASFGEQIPPSCI